MPADRRAAAPRIGIDVTPLAGARTGVGVVTDALVRRLARRDDLDVEGLVISLRGREAVEAALDDPVPIRRLPFPARFCHWAWQRADHPSLGGYDVVWGPNFVVPPNRRGAELVTVHDLTAWRYPEMVTQVAAAFPDLVDRAVDRGAHVHAVSQFVADEIHHDLGVPRDRVHVVPNAVDPVRPGDARRARRLTDGRRFVLALGTIEPRKDHATLLEAMAALDDPDVALVVAGPDGWGTEVFERAARRADLGDRLIRLGFVSDGDRADLLTGAELLVFPSVYEGFGLPVLEAMSVGTPVVATPVGALPEVAGGAVRWVPPGDVDALAEAIRALLDDPEARRALADAGHRRVGEFSWDRSADGLAAVLHRLA